MGSLQIQRMVMGTSPASSKIKKRIRETIKQCENAINIKDNIFIYGKDSEHGPVNHTSRSWTPTEAAYGQIEREGNGILTGLHMNKMYTMGTHVKVVTDHKPLVNVYDLNKPKQLCVDRHRTKLLPFRYHVIYKPGHTTSRDYGSRVIEDLLP